MVRLNALNASFGALNALKASATVVVLYAVIATVADDLHSFSFPAPPLPDDVTVLVPIGLAALVGVISAPAACCSTGTPGPGRVHGWTDPLGGANIGHVNDD